MEFAAFCDHTRRDGRRLAAVAAGNLERPVPSCPGWTVRDLVEHVAEVYEHKIACTEQGAMPDPWPPAWPSDRDPVDWLVDAHGRLLGMLGRLGPLAPSATWWPQDQTVGFWGRRMAQETVIHRVDGELAVGDETAVDVELALDGVDEVLSIFLAGDWSAAAADGCRGQRALVRSGGRAWTVVLDRDRVEVSPSGGASDATVDGPPPQMLLWLWGRTSDDRVAGGGDRSVLSLLRSRLVLATQ